MLNAYESVFEYRGLTCAVWFNAQGFRCGYVSVPDGHPWHGVESPSRLGIDVHGGCYCAGELDMLKGWFVWFDCAHSGDNRDIDALPEGPNKEEARFLYNPNGSVRSCAYVERQCRHVADQVIAAATPAADPFDLAGFIKRGLSGPPKGPDHD